MKRTLFILGLMAVTGLGMQAANRTVTDTVDGKKRVIELTDTVIDGQQTTDTLSITTYEGTDSGEATDNDTYRHEKGSLQWERLDLGEHTSETIIALTAIILSLGLPAVIIFIVFYFRYKNRKAKYRLAEQALASGQQLPPDFFKEGKESETKDLRSRGIKNIFLGIGLFIFLWALSNEFSLGCIGLLIMFTGFGQVVIYYTQPGQGDNRTSVHLRKEEYRDFRDIHAEDNEISEHRKTDMPEETPKNEPQQ